MRRAWMLTTALALGPMVSAAQPPDPPEQAPVFTSRQVQGSLTQWDAESGRLVVDAKGTATQLELQEGSTVFIDGRLGSRAELAPGQFVRAAYQERDGTQYVRWIEVTAPPLDEREGKKKPRSQRPPVAPAFGPYEGVVEELSPDTDSFVLASLEGRWTIDLKDVQLFVAGAEGSLQKLQPGARVRARWVANTTPRTLQLELLSAPSP